MTLAHIIFSKKGLLRPIWLKCRQIAAVISPFLNIFEVFYTGLGAVEDEHEDEHDEERVNFFSLLILIGRNDLL